MCKLNNEEWYIHERLQNQMNWYNCKSKQCKFFYNILLSINIIISSLIPFTTVLITSFPIAKYIVALMGSLVTILSGFISTFQYKKKWIDYRVASEILTKEYYKYNMKVEPYDRDERLNLSTLVQNTETYISKENANWIKYNTNKSSKKNQEKGEDNNVAIQKL